MSTTHKRSYIYSRGTIKATCTCGWQSKKQPDNEAGRAMVDVEIRVHTKGGK